LKRPSPSLHAAAAALLLSAVFAITTVAQAPQSAQAPSTAPSPPHRTFPAPTDLKVLPKNLTGEQVREMMETWAGSLGTHCSTCHTADPNNIAPNGRPRLKFPDDSKPEKSTARLMYTMTQDINANYVSMVPTRPGRSAPVVTCGTCHRGHVEPEPFVIPPDNGPHPPQGPPPADTKPEPPK